MPQQPREISLEDTDLHEDALFVFALDMEAAREFESVKKTA